MRRRPLLAFASLALAAAVAAPSDARPESKPRPKPAPKPIDPSLVLAKSDAEVKPGQSMQIAYNTPYGQQVAKEEEDKTLAPYFFVPGADEGSERLPLESTSADVNIAGVIARVRVHQVFKNAGKKPIEAVYVFPGSTRAAVHGMRMKIGDRTIEAKIDEREKARQDYERARDEGKRASLLEQERPNVFTMNVANIMPGDRIEVELDYSELLVPEDATYEFVYPTVVGPRYGGGADARKDGWIENPTLHAGQPEPYAFGIKVHLETGIPIKDLSSPSHKIAATFPGAASADVALDQAGGGNKDFVLRYRLSGKQIETGLLTAKVGDESFFLLMMEPPERPTDAQIPGREYIFLVDVSGSMHGFPLDTAKALMTRLLGDLRPTDYVNVVLFSGSFATLRADGSLPATPANIRLATDFVTRQQGGGGTELMGGLKGAYGIPKRKGMSRTVVVVTDGYVGVEAQVFQFIRKRLNEANAFAFGIGSSVNRALIEGMARAGLGEPLVVLNPQQAAARADKFREYIQFPVLAGIDVSFQGLDAYGVAPGTLPDLMARRPLVVYGKYRGAPRGKIVVTGVTGSGTFRREIEVSPRSLAEANAPIRYLWARKWVETLEDQMHVIGEAAELKDAITNLGLVYGILTPFTSFVAIDSEVVNKGGRGNQVRQPLPMPEGVSDLAVGGGEGKASPRKMSRAKAPARDHASSGSGYGGGRGRAAGTRTEAAELSAPPPMATPSSPSPAYRGAGGDEEPTDRPAPASVMTTSVSSDKLDNASALLVVAEPRIAAAVHRARFTGSARLAVVLTVDGKGRVTNVKLTRSTGNAALDRALVAALKGASSAARPQAGATAGTLTIQLELR